MRFRPIAAVAALVFAQGALAAPVKIKIATLAPEGTTWMNVLGAMADEIETATAGEVKFKFYPGGVAGDEHDVLRKMRVGQLHGGAFTGVGLGEILPKTRVLEIPFIYRSYEEVDYVRAQMEGELNREMEAEGYVLLGWAEAGFVNIFANEPIHTVRDLQRVKMWMWEGDPLAEAFFKAFDIAPNPLPITDVLTSLQTNLIDAIYVSPYAAVGLQWFTRVKYMMDLPLTDAIGAMVVQKKRFDRIPEIHRQTVLDICRKHTENLNETTRKDQVDAVERMKKEGIEVIAIDPAEVATWEDAGTRARESLIGVLYDRETMERVLAALETFRAENAPAANGTR